MKPFAKTAVWTLGFACLWLAAPSAEAVSPRAYVSVNGNDANTCNIPTTPCRTYTGAISQVTPGGEVIVMDSGTFGGGTITQAVTINAPLGVVALAATPIIVNPGLGSVVVLRGLTFQAPIIGSGTGIEHQSGTLFVENTVVDGWQYGLISQVSAARLFVTGSAFRNNAFHGLYVVFGSSALVAIDNSFFENNGSRGILLDGGTSRVSNTVMSGNAANGAEVEFGGTEATFQHCEVSGNYNGLIASGGAVVRISGSTVTKNTNNGLFTNATLESFGNNVVRGNGTNTSGITTVALQ